MPVIIIVTLLVLIVFGLAVWDWYKKSQALPKDKNLATAMVVGHESKDNVICGLQVMVPEVSDKTFLCIPPTGFKAETYPVGSMVDVHYYKFHDSSVHISLIGPHK